MKKKRGFTLVELLVVIAIIAILAAFLLPAIRSVRDKALLAVCKKNLNTIGTGIYMYMEDHNGQYPNCSYAEFRGGTFGMVTLLEPYLPFGTREDQNGNQTQWVDSRYTCPAYEKRNRGYSSDAITYGSYCYRHAFQGDDPNPGDDTPPEPHDGANLAGRRMEDLGGREAAGTWNIQHWTASEYGAVWDMGWIDSTPNTEPHDFDGIPAHESGFNVLFADLHAGTHLWVHRAGLIPDGSTPNIPPELRDDQYKIEQQN